MVAVVVWVVVFVGVGRVMIRFMGVIVVIIKRVMVVFKGVVFDKVWIVVNVTNVRMGVVSTLVTIAKRRL